VAHILRLMPQTGRMSTMSRKHTPENGSVLADNTVG
jgi:hypothetical protein